MEFFGSTIKAKVKSTKGIQVLIFDRILMPLSTPKIVDTKNTQVITTMIVNYIVTLLGISKR